jgi:hypothetical protein
MKHPRSHDRQNQQLQKKNQKLLGEVAPVRNKRVGPGEARTKVKAETTGKIAAWIVPRLREALR